VDLAWEELATQLANAPDLGLVQMFEVFGAVSKTYLCTVLVPTCLPYLASGPGLGGAGHPAGQHPRSRPCTDARVFGTVSKTYLSSVLVPTYLLYLAGGPGLGGVGHPAGQSPPT
jgi:hypothetical protein